MSLAIHVESVPKQPNMLHDKYFQLKLNLIHQTLLSELLDSATCKPVGSS